MRKIVVVWFFTPRPRHGPNGELLADGGGKSHKELPGRRNRSTPISQFTTLFGMKRSSGTCEIHAVTTDEDTLPALIQHLTFS